jgi:hypothetical protein
VLAGDAGARRGRPKKHRHAQPRSTDGLPDAADRLLASAQVGVHVGRAHREERRGVALPRPPQFHDKNTRRLGQSQSKRPRGQTRASEWKQRPPSHQVECALPQPAQAPDHAGTPRKRPERDRARRSGLAPLRHAPAHAVHAFTHARTRARATPPHTHMREARAAGPVPSGIAVNSWCRAQADGGSSAGDGEGGGGGVWGGGWVWSRVCVHHSLVVEQPDVARSDLVQ